MLPAWGDAWGDDALECPITANTSSDTINNKNNTYNHEQINNNTTVTNRARQAALARQFLYNSRCITNMLLHYI